MSIFFKNGNISEIYHPLDIDGRPMWLLQSEIFLNISLLQIKMFLNISSISANWDISKDICTYFIDNYNDIAIFQKGWYIIHVDSVKWYISKYFINMYIYQSVYLNIWRGVRNSGSECDLRENFDTNECPNIFVSTKLHKYSNTLTNECLNIFVQTNLTRTNVRIYS